MRVERPLLPLGEPRRERADAVRNRELLLRTVRAMLAEEGAGAITMDALADRAGLGKGTVFRRFHTRAGIFQALLDDDEAGFQHRVLRGPPPLGPGEDAATRLVAYGRARIAFLLDHLLVAREALDPRHPVLAREGHITRVHLRMLLGQVEAELPDLDIVTIQLAGALEGPLLLYVATSRADASPPPDTDRRLADGWQVLVERLVRR